MANSSCIICNGAYKSFSIPGLKQCTNCEFVTTDISLSSEELADLYSDQYFMGEEYRNYIEEKNVILKNFAAKLRKVLKYIDKPQQKTAFEVGAAYGFFLELAGKCFKSASGIDISSDAVTYAKKNGVDIRCQDFLTYELPHSYDNFFLWDTIEHLQSPHLYIEKISKNISQGGHVVITTGDIDSLNAKIRKSKWRQIHPPTHLHYFSLKTLTKLLEKNGFSVVHSSHPGNYHSIDNILYIILVLKQKKPRLYRALKKSGMATLINYVYVNFFDIMMVVAKKK